MSGMHTYPRWIEEDADHNLRAVAPGLYVGAELSPGLRPEGDWAAVIDFYGSSDLDHRWYLYEGSTQVERMAFIDGEGFPPDVLPRVVRIVHEALPKGPVLLHCQAGLSRSASAAYAALRVLGGKGHQEALGRVKIMPGFPRTETLASARRWAESQNLGATRR
jgi:hypothetical protein